MGLGVVVIGDGVCLYVGKRVMTGSIVGVGVHVLLFYRVGVDDGGIGGMLLGIWPPVVHEKMGVV